MRTASVPRSVPLALCLAISLLGGLADEARADRRDDDTAMIDVSDGAAPIPTVWRASRLVDSVVLAGQRALQTFRGATHEPAPLLSWHQHKAQRETPKSRVR